MRILLQLVRSHSVLLLNAGSLIGTSAVTSLLGFVYWWLAARQFSPQAVGFSSAAISAMTLLGTVCMLGLGTLLIGELKHQTGKEESLISAALIVVGVVGGCFGIVFALVAPYLSADFNALRASIQIIVLFALGVSLTAITLVLDQAFIGLLRGELQLWRNTLFALVKLAALFVIGLWFSNKVGMTIYATWVVGIVLSLVILAGFAILKGHYSERIFQPEWELLRKQSRSALQHHTLNLTLQAPSQILPILVTILLSATMNAWFYVSFMIANFVFLTTLALTIVLYSMSSSRPSVVAHNVRLTLILSVGIVALANCVLLFGTNQVLGLFGHIYAEQAVWSLRILALGAFPLIIKNHYVAVLRIQKRMTLAILPILAGSLLELGAAALGAHLGGLSGLSLGWVIGISIEALFMSQTVYKAIRANDASIDSTELQDYMMSSESKVKATVRE
ncbi:MAG TPA: oligosaccharide flippase family protein [Ktedonobacteraceae bacterium]|nr:oligosaccharide flippase family protein [Ktedonobacteraceae bacterium]